MKRSGYSILKSKTGSFTRDVSIASGNQSVTGIGFQPRAVIFITCIAGTTAGSNGVDDGTTHVCVYNYTDGKSYTIGTASIELETGASDRYGGSVLTFDPDGFTVSWVKAGAIVGTGTIMFEAFR